MNQVSKSADLAVPSKSKGPILPQKCAKNRPPPQRIFRPIWPEPLPEPSRHSPRSAIGFPQVVGSRGRQSGSIVRDGSARGCERLVRFHRGGRISPVKLAKGAFELPHELSKVRLKCAPQAPVMGCDGNAWGDPATKLRAEDNGNFKCSVASRPLRCDSYGKNAGTQPRRRAFEKGDQCVIRISRCWKMQPASLHLFWMEPCASVTGFPRIRWTSACASPARPPQPPRIGQLDTVRAIR